jgi:glucuronate isomerase
MAKLSEFEKNAQSSQSPLHAQLEDAKKRRLELLNSDAGKDSPEASQLGESVNHLLSDMREPRLRSDVAFGLLNDKQRALAADLENTFLLIGQAIDLNLLPRHYQAEGGLCH